MATYRKPAKARKPTKAKKTIRVRRRKPDDDDADESTEYAKQWWRCDPDDENGAAAAGALWLWIDRLRQRWAADNLVDLIHEAIYEGRPLGTSVEFPAMQHLRMKKSAPANLNITRSMVDTATARLTKKRPMPCVTADDAGWSEKLFAKRTSRILRRKMGGSKVERMSPDVIRAMIIRGTGCAKTVRNGGDVDIEHVPRYELVVDPREARYGTPRVLAHVKPIAREVLCEEYPEFEELIESAPAYNRVDPWMQFAYDGPTFTDHIECAESWHLPSGPNATDGEHIITIRGVTILREKWTRPRFPIAFCHWSAPVRGFWGHGLVEDLTGIQAKVNDVCRDIQEALYFGSMLKVFQARTANVNKSHLRARHPVVVEYDGTPPQYVAPNPVSQQSIQFMELLIKEAYEISGISQMAASSKNTLGSNASGRAIDTMDDIQSDRFAHVEAGYMTFRVDLGQCMIDEARAMYEEAHGTEEEYGTLADRLTPKDLSPWIEEHDWSKVMIDGGNYHLSIEPQNFIPDTRGGKLSFVAELSKAGLIPDPSMTADLFDEPDIARANRTILGPKHALDKIMEGLASPEVPMIDLMPTVQMNLPLGMLMAKGEWNDAFASDAPEHVLQRYIDWMTFVKRLLEQSTAADGSPSLPGMQATTMGASPNAATLQPGMGAGGPPMGPPGMPPPGAPPPGMAPPQPMAA